MQKKLSEQNYLLPIINYCISKYEIFNDILIKKKVIRKGRQKLFHQCSDFYFEFFGEITNYLVRFDYGEKFSEKQIYNFKIFSKIYIFTLQCS